MHTKLKRRLSKAIGCLFVLAISAGVTSAVVVLRAQVLPTESSEAAVVNTTAASTRHDPHIAQALKLRARLLRENLLVPPAGILRNALRERQALLARQLIVRFDAGAQSPAPWTIALADHPGWLSLTTSLLSAHYAIDPTLVEHALRTEEIPGLARPSDARAEQIEQDEKGVLRVTIDGMAQEGYVFDSVNTAERIAQALEYDHKAITVSATVAGGGMALSLPDGQQKRLQLLAVGESDFAKSPEARIWNIKKALHERLNGIVIPADAPFSFNATLGGPVTLGKGWKEALGIFGGGTAMTPGGGICQAATTTYRAAMFGGFPILERKSHSLYVTYYEKGGVGIDATIFPGQQNLVFVNDSGNELIMHARVDGTKATVALYGIPDGRRVAIEGPYFSTTPDRPAGLLRLRHDQIGWLQRVEYPDGRSGEKSFISTYQKGIPSRLRKEYAVTEIENMHAAAPTATAEAPELQSATDDSLQDRT